MELKSDSNSQLSNESNILKTRLEIRARMHRPLGLSHQDAKLLGKIPLPLL